MKQILQHLKSSKTSLEELPASMVRPGHVLISSSRCLVSLDTERCLVEFSRANLIDKIRESINIPITVMGGAGNLFVFKGKLIEVLINYPTIIEKKELINKFFLND